MKPIYNFLQEFAIFFFFLFGLSPNSPPYFQRIYSSEYAVNYSWVLTITSVIVFALCFWWMKASWVLKKPGYMVALSFGSALGMLIGISALIGIAGGEPRFYLQFRELPTTILEAGMLLAIAFQLLFIDKDGSIINFR